MMVLTNRVGGGEQQEGEPGRGQETWTLAECVQMTAFCLPGTPCHFCASCSRTLWPFLKQPAWSLLTQNQRRAQGPRWVLGPQPYLCWQLRDLPRPCRSTPAAPSFPPLEVKWVLGRPSSL